MTKTPGLERFRQFRPLDRLSDKQLVLLAANSKQAHYQANDIVMAMNSADKQEYFLVSGQVELKSFDGRLKQISAGTESARTAIALLQPRKYEVTATQPCEFLIVSQHVVEALLAELPRQRDVEFSVSDIHSGHETEDIEQSFLDDLANNDLKLPSFPDVALRIRQLLNEPEVGVEDIAKALKSDPAITVKLLKTCNSVLYRRANAVTSAQDAIVRLGFDTTRQLVTIFAMNELFASKSPFLHNKMCFLWLHSREVAATAYVLAKITPGMNPELALLAGLMQDIGVIPVLNYIERYPQFMKTDQKVDEITKDLKARVGATLLKAWGFSGELIAVAANTENWQFEHGADQATYADICIVAQLHTLIGKKYAKNLPRFDEVPALKKLGTGGLTPQQSQAVLHESHEQIKELQALLGAEHIPVVS